MCVCYKCVCVVCEVMCVGSFNVCARGGRVHMCVCYLISCVCACVRGDDCGIISCVCSRRTRSYVRVLSDFMCVCVCVRGDVC